MKATIGVTIVLIIAALIGGYYVFSQRLMVPPAKEETKNGVIQGKATIGPICPVERVGVPCPVPPEAYTSREIVVYDESGTRIVSRTHFDTTGHYRIELPAGIYVLDIPRGGVGGSKNLPQQIRLHAGETIEVNPNIDTGIR